MSSFVYISMFLCVGQLDNSPRPITATTQHRELPADSLENSAIRIALNNRLAEVNFQYTDLDQALHELSSKGRINLNVDWAALREFTIFADTPVTLNVRDIRLIRAIEAVLQSADGGQGILASKIDDGILLVTTQQRLDSALQTRIYSIEHVLNVKLDAREQFELQLAVSALWMRHFHVFAPPWEWMPSHVHSPPSNHRTGPLIGPERESKRILDQLLERLRTKVESELFNAIHNIAPQSWIERGGAGTIQRINNKLVIRQSARVHSEIERLLGELAQNTPTEKPDSK